jgi:hypothetical protein
MTYKLEGQVFNRLTVIERDGKVGNHIAWKCQCECGTITRVSSQALRNGSTKSCGCLSRELTLKRITKHGKSQLRAYSIWKHMLERCRNPKSTNYRNYGGRGILVDERWEKFENFHADMGDPPTVAHTLDRRDNNGNYTKSNCRWSTKTEQANNRRNSACIAWKDETRTLTEWARHLGIPRGTIRSRLALGWTIDEALSGEKNEQTT